MLDKFRALISRADLMFQQPNTAKLLVSWNHSKEDFEIHNLTDLSSTADYFKEYQLDPLFFIISYHMTMLRDESVLQSIAQGWYLIIHELSMPPCLTPITLPIPKPESGAPV